MAVHFTGICFVELRCVGPTRGSAWKLLSFSSQLQPAAVARSVIHRLLIVTLECCFVYVLLVTQWFSCCVWHFCGSTCAIRSCGCNEVASRTLDSASFCCDVDSARNNWGKVLMASCLLASVGCRNFVKASTVEKCWLRQRFYWVAAVREQRRFMACPMCICIILSIVCGTVKESSVPSCGKVLTNLRICRPLIVEVGESWNGQTAKGSCC